VGRSPKVRAELGQSTKLTAMLLTSPSISFGEVVSFLAQASAASPAADSHEVNRIAVGHEYV